MNSGLNGLKNAGASIQAGDPAEAALRLSESVPPQLRFTAGDALPFVKKVCATTRFYLLSNPTDKTTDTTVEFDESPAPEIWDPWTGKSTNVAFRRVGGRESVQLSLPPYGSELIVFDPAHPYVGDVGPEEYSELKLQNVGNEGWMLTAKGNSERGVGVQEQIMLDKLADWRSVPELRTFSGIATYVAHVSVDGSDLKRADKVVLELGEVKDAATVTVNGKRATVLITHPFTVDIRPLLKAGDNTLEVSVVNSLTNYVSTIQWPKRSDAFPIAHFQPVASGLLGPVTLKFEAPTKTGEGAGCRAS